MLCNQGGDASVAWRFTASAAVLLLCLLVFSGKAVKGAPPFLQGGPRLRVEPERFDFGELLSGEKGRRKVRLTNEGDQALHFQAFEFSCGCSIPRITLSTGEIFSLDDLGKKGKALILPPGTWADVEIEFSSLGRRGRVVHKVTIKSDDPSKPVRTLPIVARIRPAFTLTPRTLDFGTVDRRGKTSRTITLTPAFAGEYGITGFENLPAFMTWKAEKVARGPVTLTRLTLTLKGGAPPGRNDLVLRARVESSRTQGVAVPVAFTVLPDVSFRCGEEEIVDTIDFGIIPSGKATERRVHILNKNPRVPYVIDGLELEGRFRKNVTVRLDTIRPGVEYNLWITVTPRPGMHYFRVMLYMLSRHPELKHMKLDIKGMVSAAGGGVDRGG